MPSTGSSCRSMVVSGADVAIVSSPDVRWVGRVAHRAIQVAGESMEPTPVDRYAILVNQASRRRAPVASSPSGRPSSLVVVIHAAIMTTGVPNLIEGRAQQ